MMRNHSRWPELLVSLALLVLAMPLYAAVTLPALFSDNMVLQQGIAAPIWGTAAAGEKITVKFHRQTQRATAGADGRWTVKLAPEKAGGPFTLQVRGTNTLTVNNVLVGEVWVCSGQSNMAKAVQEAANWEDEVAHADYPQIRMLTVDTLATSVPADDLVGQWQVCSPQVAENFSAAAYYFARNLHQSLKVPIGIIQASYGGSPVESWLPPSELDKHPELHLAFDAKLAKVDFAQARALQLEQIHNLMLWGPADPARWGTTKGWDKPDFDDAAWPTMELPVVWDKVTPSLAEVGGAWFRKEVTIPAGWEGKPLVLKLGRIAWMDDTYWNGTKVGHLGFDNCLVIPCGDSRRRYHLPASLAKAGRLVIAVHVINPGYWGSYGGITEPPMNLAPENADPKEAISLTGTWRYQVEFRRTDKDLSSTTATPKGSIPMWMVTSLYHGMLAPVVPYGIKGVAWYQGESNSDRPYQYRTLLPMMISGWRAAWGEGDFPFLIVQLPAYKQQVADPGESNWALLRESQAMTAAAAANSALVTTIDIGDANDIHPKNKQEVGRRLSQAAQALAYRLPLEAAGPRFEKMTVEGATIRLTFSHANGLVAKPNPSVVQGKPGDLAPKGFAIAGDDHRFVWATARIEGATVVVSSPDVPKPVAVRYAWADNPECNLYNAAGLPATPFRTDDWRSRPTLREVVLNHYNPKQLRVSFNDVGEEGLKKDQPLTGFLVAGDDKVFFPAKTSSYGGDLLVYSDLVPKPVAVRYAWPGSPAEGQGNLCAGSGIAVLPFRSDNWTDAMYTK